MERGDVVAQLINRGIVSRVLVFTNLIHGFVFSLCFSCLIWIFDNGIHVMLVGFVFSNIFFHIFNYLIAPVAYKKYEISSQGIKFGKIFVDYSRIQSISINKGYVEEWYGFRFIENVFEIPQHNTYFVEDMICINGEFTNFRKADCVYIPLNEKNDNLLKMYSQKYVDILNTQPKNELGLAIYDKKQIKTFFATAVPFCLFMCAVLVIFVYNGFIKTYKALIFLPLVFAAVFFPFLKGHFTQHLRKIRFFR